MNIILGITGSIAAYKAAILTRILVKKGHHVQIIMTEASKAFITPLTLSTLSKNPVHSNLFQDDTWDNHVELGLWADAFVIAPVTASTLSKMANGQSDNMLLATYLSAKCPIFFAPAMDLDMWKHPSTKRNLELLASYGNHLIPVENGELASGLVGEGRMAEPEHIVEHLDEYFKIEKDLFGQKVLVTAGPTYEDLDPVRFIGNNSSGKMGIAIAEEAKKRGAEVVLVQGPGQLQSEGLDHVIKVRSAQEMYEACEKNFEVCTIAVFAAAVADYTPESRSKVKLKKKDGEMSIPLKRTTDIAATLGARKRKDQLMVGFALETNDAVQNAQRKLKKKNFDFIVLNTLEDEGAGFQHDTNKVQFVLPEEDPIVFDLKPKKKVAVDIIDQLVKLLLKEKKSK
jgi:phosphopantothenoylcysteine decarboxylase/phosphopantothenate--cysteine ligase